MKNPLTEKLKLDTQEKAQLGAKVSRLKSVADFLSDALDAFKETALISAVAQAAPWAGAFGGALSETVPPVKFALELFRSLTDEHDPDALGFLAATLAYQRAVEQTIASIESPENARKAAGEVKQQLRALEPTADLDMRKFSFRGANGHTFVEHSDKALRLWVESVGYGEAQSRAIVLGVHRRFVANLKTILAHGELKERFAPFTQKIMLGTEEELAYDALLEHAERQRRLFEEAPVFDKEPFALKHVYVETECGQLPWGDIVREQRAYSMGQMSEANRIDPFAERWGGRTPLLDVVMEMIGDPTFKDAVIIQGVAGSGKSSFTLRLCSELIREGLHPLRVRLRDLDLSRSIMDALPRALFPSDFRTDAESPAPPRPKDLFLGGSIFDERTPFRGTEICPYVIILDGWDEISISATTGYKLRVTKMLEEIRSEFLRNRDVPVRVVLTGRPSNEVNESKFLRESTPVLTMRPLRPEHLRRFVGNIKRALDERPVAVEAGDANEELWRIEEIERFDSLFKRYEEEFNKTLEAAGKDAAGAERRVWEMESGSLDVLGLPLLAHLTIRLAARWSGGGFDEMSRNPTTLYRSLVDLTCEKGGKPVYDRGEVGDQFRVVGGELRSLLRRTAVAMTMYGEESISFTELARRLDVPDEELDREVESATGDHYLSSLVVSFFFKGGHRHLGCEFLHKSFREYLYAEAIIECLKEYGRRQAKSPPEREPYWADFDPSRDHRHEFSRDLSEMLSAQWLSREVVSHLDYLILWELNRENKGDETEAAGNRTAPLDMAGWKRVRDGLADLWDWWAEGVHLRPQPIADRYTGVITFDKPYVQTLVEVTAPFDRARRIASLEPKRTVTMDSHLGDALFRLCTYVHYFVALADGWAKSRSSDIFGSSAQEMWEVVSPPGQGPRRYQSVVQQERGSWVLFAPAGKDPNYFVNYCNRINAAGWRPVGPFPLGVDMYGIDLRGGTISIPVFVTQRYPDSTWWVRSNLARTVFAGSRLIGHAFAEVNAPRAVFTNATASDSGFYDSFMPRCVFQRADLTGTAFHSCNLTRADFTGADVAGASFYYSDFRRARLAVINAESARFKRLQLEGSEGLSVNVESSDEVEAISPDDPATSVDEEGEDD